jgi:hypothetical protein
MCVEICLENNDQKIVGLLYFAHGVLELRKMRMNLEEAAWAAALCARCTGASIYSAVLQPPS